MTFISLVIPCYNEENRFEEGFRHYFNYLKKQNYSWEIILVNDGSNDKTLELMNNKQKEHKSIELVSYKNNKGKGYALKKAFEKAKAKYILFADIDHSVDISTVQNFYPYLKNNYQVVIGSRRVKGSKFLKKQNVLRIFLGRCFSLLVRIVVDWRIRDATCGFKAFDRESARKIFSKVSIYDWAFDAEILFLVKKFNLKIIEVPVSWRDVAGSKVSLSKDIVSSLLGLFKIRLNDFQGKYN